MLNLDSYEIKTNQTHFDYEFESVGPKGVIKKVARFNLMQDDIYNFGFGDLDEFTGEISDTVVSNNGDGDKILATVAQIIFFFTGIYQESWVFIKGSTSSRTRWYQMGIAKYWDHIKLIFEIQGYRSRKWEPFEKGKNYEAFLGRRRTSLFYFI